MFAVANGVVRVSIGVAFDQETDLRNPDPAALPWGNFIAIEHRLGDDEYCTTLYGHLGPERYVEAGDVVSAGQQIGTIGRKHPRINGGYEPHLHFGVREGRPAEIGAVILQLSHNGRPLPLTLEAVDEESIELSAPEEFSGDVSLMMNGEPIALEWREDRLIGPTSLMVGLQRPDFALVGYDLSTEGWHDPIRFLRERRADTHPALFQLHRSSSRR